MFRNKPFDESNLPTDELDDTKFNCKLEEWKNNEIDKANTKFRDALTHGFFPLKKYGEKIDSIHRKAEEEHDKRYYWDNT